MESAHRDPKPQLIGAGHQARAEPPPSRGPSAPHSHLPWLAAARGPSVEAKKAGQGVHLPARGRRCERAQASQARGQRVVCSFHRLLCLSVFLCLFRLLVALGQPRQAGDLQPRASVPQSDRPVSGDGGGGERASTMRGSSEGSGQPSADSEVWYCGPPGAVPL